MKNKGHSWIFVVVLCRTSALAWQGMVDDELTPRNGLPNLFRKIADGDSLNVAYLGGSITAQPGWRVQSLDWLRHRFPKASFRETNAAIGGTGSDFGAFRLNEQVLRYDPDLVFVEFAVNDQHSSEDKIIRSIESIVTQIWKRDPLIDICFVYTTIESFLTKEQRGNLPASALAMEKVADRYGIPSINFGKEVYSRVSKGEFIITGKEQQVDGKKVFSRDGVHPYPETGHVIYTTVLKRCFEDLANQKRPKRKRHSLPQPLIGDGYSSPQMLRITETQLSQNWEMINTRKDARFSGFRNYLDTVGKGIPGESLSFRFKGKALGAYDFMGPDTGRIVMTLDGVSDTVSRFDAYCTYMRMNYFIIDSLEDREHNVEISVLKTTFDKAGILATRGAAMDDPAKFSANNWYVGKILIDGKLLDH